MLSEVIRHAKILIVDDELPNVRLLELILEREGYRNISMTTDPRHALPLFQDNQPDLVLLDLNMPYITGYEVLESLGALQTPEVAVPTIVLTADSTPQAKRRALTNGATDFVCKPFDNLEVVQRIKNVLQTRFLHLELMYQNQILEERVKERAARLETTLVELHTTQQQVMQEERLRALGKMAAGIAHDFNNILSLILGYGEMLLSENSVAEGNGPGAKYVRNIISASQDGVEMVKRLAQFQRPASEGDLQQTIDLNALITQAVELTRPRWQGEARANNAQILVRTEFSPGANIVGDPAEIRDLLINAIFNAVDAMPEGGTITFRTHVEEDAVVLEIEDTGGGMSRETRERCLEPFFTTKGARGTGLGLAMIYGITQRHHGTLEIESEPGAGTKLQVRLPNERPRGVEKVAVTAAQPNEPLEILVVDDQPLLCEILIDHLTKDGHHVTSANSGEEALEKFRRGQFDLVVTDSAMPGMSGNELAVAVRKARDETMVILITGFADSGVAACDAPEIDALVGKPVAVETLRQAIAHAVIEQAKRLRPAGAHVPTAGFLRTRPEGALTLSSIAAHLTRPPPEPALLKTRSQS